MRTTFERIEGLAVLQIDESAFRPESAVAASIVRCRRPAARAWSGPAPAGKCGTIRRGPNRRAPACCRASRTTAGPAFHPESGAAACSAWFHWLPAGRRKHPAASPLSDRPDVSRWREPLRYRIAPGLEVIRVAVPRGFPVRESIFNDQRLESFWLGEASFSTYTRRSPAQASAGPSRASAKTTHRWLLAKSRISIWGCMSVGSWPIHAPQKRDPLAVRGPGRRTEEIAGLAGKFSGLLSVRSHQPEFLALERSFQKRDLRAVGRDRRFAALVGRACADFHPGRRSATNRAPRDGPASEVARMCDPSGNQQTGFALNPSGKAKG